MSAERISPGLRLEIRLLAGFLIAFGLINHALQAMDPLSASIPIPSGVILPGGFLVIAGIGTFLRHEWAFKLGCLLCLIHLTISVVSWPLSLVDATYVFACALGAAESGRVLVLTRRVPGRPD